MGEGRIFFAAKKRIFIVFFSRRHQMPDDQHRLDRKLAIHIAEIVVGRRMDILRSEELMVGRRMNILRSEEMAVERRKDRLRNDVRR